MNAPGWYPDPVGRHDFRLWSGSGWTHQVSDDGSQGADPIEPLKPEPVTIRPSTSVFWKLFRSVPVWRWGLSLVLLAIVILMMYLAGGWLLVMALGTLGILCVVLLPVLYFKLFCIRADSAGIEVRNQIGHRHRIPRERIAAVTIGKAWAGGFTPSNFAFIVSPKGERLGRFYLQNWDPKDFGRIASALGLHLYGRPGRTLDQFHSAKALEYVARFYGGSLVTGAVIGCALPVLLILVLAIAVLLARAGGH
jgi:hypothetical protein